MLESVLTISNFWPVGYKGVSEHGSTDFRTRLLDTLSEDPELPLKSKTKKMDSGAIVCEVTKSIVPATEIRLLASAAKVHRGAACACSP